MIGPFKAILRYVTC